MFEDPVGGVWADPFVGLAGSDEALFEEEGAEFGLVEGGEGVIEGVPEGFGEGAGAFRFWFCMGLHGPVARADFVRFEVRLGESVQGPQKKALHKLGTRAPHGDPRGLVEKLHDHFENAPEQGEIRAFGAVVAFAGPAGGHGHQWRGHQRRGVAVTVADDVLAECPIGFWGRRQWGWKRVPAAGTSAVAWDKFRHRLASGRGGE